MTDKQLASKMKKLADEILALVDNEEIARKIAKEAPGNATLLVESLMTSHGKLAEFVVSYGGPAWNERDGWEY